MTLPFECRRLIFLSSHFAAHLEKLEERNADYARIVRCLRFENTSATPPTSPKVRISLICSCALSLNQSLPFALKVCFRLIYCDVPCLSI